ncbi:MAG: hypothetical protein IJU45_08060 [Clostridia bacterium]|nr:hypothetical protein [Clostridia bacterium]
MNKTGIKILCIIISAVTLLSMFGCSKKPKVSDKDGSIVNAADITNKDGDIVIKNEVTDKDGNVSEVTQLIDGTGIDTPIYVQSGVTKRDNFVSEIAKRSFDMPEETAKSVVEKPDSWKEFYVSEYIKNTSDKHMAFKSISIENNGTNGLWISKELDAEFTFAPGTTELFNIWALADASKLKDGEAIEKAFKDTKINLTYTLIDDPMGDIDWDKAELKELVIH